MAKHDGRERLYGITPVEAALRAERRALHELWCRRSRGRERNERVAAVVALAGDVGLPVREADADDLTRRAGTPVHQGLVLVCGALPLTPARDLIDGPAGDGDVILALDQVEDPQNVGGLVRTAAFLGARAVLLHRSRRAPLSATVSKASAGTLENFPVAESGNLADALLRFARAGWRVVGSALDPAAVDHRRLDPGPPTVLVLGNEGRGIRPLTAKRCDELVSIARRGPAESLNVTVAAAVLLDHLTAGADQT